LRFASRHHWPLSVDRQLLSVFDRVVHPCTPLLDSDSDSPALAKLLFLLDKATNEPFHPRSKTYLAENFR
jgi:hypothetical protein